MALFSRTKAALPNDLGADDILRDLLSSDSELAIALRVESLRIWARHNSAPAWINRLNRLNDRIWALTESGDYWNRRIYIDRWVRDRARFLDLLNQLSRDYYLLNIPVSQQWHNYIDLDRSRDEWIDYIHDPKYRLGIASSLRDLLIGG